MGEVIALLRVMPDGMIEDEDLQQMIDDIKSVIKEPVKMGKVEVKDIAFGLRGLHVTVSVPDEEGGLDPVVDTISGVTNVDSVEIVDVGRI